MGIRGRKSTASLAVAATESASLQKMPEPPSYLTPEQDVVWREIISSRAGDLIGPEAYRLLVEYCRAIVEGDKIASQLDAFDPTWLGDDEGLKRWDKLQAIACRNQGVVATLATKLRLATSSTVRAENAGTVMKKGAKLKPWEMAIDD